MAWLFKGKGKKIEKKLKEKSDAAVENTMATIHILEQKISYNEKLIEQDLADAKAFKKNGNLKKARESIKKKKIREMNIEKWNKMKFNLEVQLNMIPEAEMNTKVFNLYKDNMQVIMSQFKTDNIEKIEEEIDYMMDQQDEINEITNTIANVDFCLGIDECEIDQEFDELGCEQEVYQTQILSCKADQSNKDNQQLDTLLGLNAC